MDCDGILQRECARHHAAEPAAVGGGRGCRRVRGGTARARLPAQRVPPHPPRRQGRKHSADRGRQCEACGLWRGSTDLWHAGQALDGHRLTNVDVARDDRGRLVRLQDRHLVARHHRDRARAVQPSAPQRLATFTGALPDPAATAADARAGQALERCVRTLHRPLPAEGSA